MNIFMEKKSCLVKKIKQTDNGWNLYPVDEEEKPIFISRENYSGDMPPFFKWPWQQVRLKITQIQDFQVSASIDDIMLFEIPEKDYPEEIKKRLLYGEKLQKDYEEEQNKANEAIAFEADNDANATLQQAQTNQANAEQQVQMTVEELKSFADNVGSAVEALANGMTNVNNLLNQVINEKSSEKMRDFQKGVSKIFDWGLKVIREPTKILRGVVGKLEAATAEPGQAAQTAQNDANAANATENNG